MHGWSHHVRKARSDVIKFDNEERERKKRESGGVRFRGSELRPLQTTLRLGWRREAAGYEHNTVQTSDRITAGPAAWRST